MIFIEDRHDSYEHLLAKLTAEFGDLDALPVRVLVRRGKAETPPSRC